MSGVLRAGRGRRPTMVDVAARAGVSLKTVSRVVNAEAGVSAEITERVRRVIAELGFRPDAGARSLRRADRRTGTIGVLLADLAEPYSAGVLRAVVESAWARGMVVLAGSAAGDAEQERALVGAYAARRVDGLLLAPATRDQSWLVPEVAGGIAVVCLDREPDGLPLDAVLSAGAAAAEVGRVAAAVLLARIDGLAGGPRTHRVPTAR